MLVHAIKLLIFCTVRKFFLQLYFQFAHLISVATTVSVYMSLVCGRWTVIVPVNSVGSTSRVWLSVVAGKEVEATGFLG